VIHPSWLLRYAPQQPPDCPGWVNQHGVRYTCAFHQRGRGQCLACRAAEQLARQRRDAQYARRAQRQSFGEAPAGTDPFRGFREE